MRRDCRCPRAQHVHGTEQAYISDGCRCGECRLAHARKAAWRRRMRAYGRDIACLVPAAGSARRLHALAAIGWSFPALADRLGWDPATLLRIQFQSRTTSGKAAAIAALYDELWDRKPPARTKSQRISSNRTRALARRRGWLPPLALDDDRIDDPDYVPVMPADRRPVSECGTVSGARRHYRAREPLCPECHDAQLQDGRRRRQKQAAA